MIMVLSACVLLKYRVAVAQVLKDWQTSAITLRSLMLTQRSYFSFPNPTESSVSYLFDLMSFSSETQVR